MCNGRVIGGRVTVLGLHPTKAGRPQEATHEPAQGLETAQRPQSNPASKPWGTECVN